MWLILVSTRFFLKMIMKSTYLEDFSDIRNIRWLWFLIGRRKWTLASSRYQHWQTSREHAWLSFVCSPPSICCFLSPLQDFVKITHVSLPRSQVSVPDLFWKKKKNQQKPKLWNWFFFPSSWPLAFLKEAVLASFSLCAHVDVCVYVCTCGCVCVHVDVYTSSRLYIPILLLTFQW